MSNTEKLLFFLFVVAIFAIAFCVGRALGQDGRSRPFTPQDCSALCQPLPVFVYVPGFCHIPGDNEQVINCAGPNSTSRVVPVGSVCVCGLSNR